MSQELHAGTFTALFARIEVEGERRSRVSLEEIARIIERQAKINASSGSHKRGTPTPAQPGTGPAIISGTLRRSVTHSPIIRDAIGWTTKVGLAAGVTPPYGKTTSSKYGKALETGLKNGTKFPFLLPAYKFGIGAAPGVHAQVFGAAWPRI